MKQKQFNGVAGVVFSVIAILHLARLLFRWEAVVDGREIPVWISLAAVLVAGYLAYSAFKLKR